MGEFLRRVCYLIQRRRLSAELESEMEFHRETAARQGRHNLGNWLQIREQAQEAWGWTWLDQLAQDMRWAGRGLLRAPGSALAIVVLLALGMGGVTALFGPLYSLVLRPLPFPHSEQLVRIGAGGSLPEWRANQTVFTNRRSLGRIFSAVTAYTVGQDVLSGDGPTVQVDVALVSREFFAALGVQPRLGAGIPADPEISDRYDASDQPGVFVSDQIWRTRLQSTRDLSKCSITLSGKRAAVIGVMPRDFDFPSGVKVWRAGQVGGGVLVGRLWSGLSMGKAQAFLKAGGSREALERGWLALESLHDFLLGSRRSLLWILSAVSGLFLVLACAGAANLLLARGARRRQEMVLRTVLGAGRGRLIRQLLMEALLLSAAGGLFGLAFSVLANHGMRLLLPAGMEGGASFSPGTVALLVVLTLAVTILCGMAPAFHATGADLNSSLKAGNSGLSASAPGRRMFTAHERFAGGQLILAMVLLGSTGLLLHSMFARLNFPLGFQPKDVAVVKIDLPPLPAANDAVAAFLREHPRGARSKNDVEVERAALEPSAETEAARNAFYYSEVAQRLAGLPGVVSMALMNDPPFTGRDVGSVLVKPRFGERVVLCDVSFDAFRVLNIPLLAGRTFQRGDLPPADAWKYVLFGSRYFTGIRETPGVAIVSATTARRLWPDQDPLGQMVVDGNDGTPRRVIGVVADIHESRNSLNVLPKVYRLFTASDPNHRQFSFIIKLRPGTPLAPFAAAVKGNLPPLPPDAAPPAILPLEESQGDLPLALALLSCFSALGIVVAGLGVYATATVMAAARTREMGVRLAIGASAEQIARLVLWRSIRLALLALPVGALGAWGLGIYLKHWLFQVGAADPASYLISAAVLLVIALAAGLWPAIQAARTDPLTALRCDG
jgi:hypothetical protein